MRRLGSMHKARRNTHTLHRRHRLPPNKPALPYSTDDDFAAAFLRLDDAVDRPAQSISGMRIRLVVSADVRQRLRLDQKHPRGASKAGRLLGFSSHYRRTG